MTDYTYNETVYVIPYVVRPVFPDVIRYVKIYSKLVFHPFLHRQRINKNKFQKRLMRFHKRNSAFMTFHNHTINKTICAYSNTLIVV